MTAREVQVSGERLSRFLRHPIQEWTRVVVSPPPQAWAPLKPALVHFMRGLRERGATPPEFSGVPVCLFGSEWQGFNSVLRKMPARGRCSTCQAYEACGFPSEVPDELLPISTAPLAQRWRDYSAALRSVTGSDMADTSTPLLDKIAAAYRGPISLEPSVLVTSEAVDAAVRFVVFPHRAGTGETARAEYDESLDCVAAVLADLGATQPTQLLDGLRRLSPSPMPIGLDGRDGTWTVKAYLRLEDKALVERRALVDEIARVAAGMSSVSIDHLQMIGLVLDDAGLHTVKAYVAAQPTRAGGDGYPAPLPVDHRLVSLSGDRALATLDIWRRGQRRSNKWDFNLRDHYLAGQSARDLVAEIASPDCAARLAPLLVGPSYRADIVAVGTRHPTLALYMELN